MTYHNTLDDPNLAGDFAEYYAVTWLWDNGYHVFKNCGCTGPIDIVALTPDFDVVYIDVKTARANSKNEELFNKTQSLTPLQKQLGVNILLFDPRDRSCRFIEHRHETTYTRHRNQQLPLDDMDSGDAGC